LASLAVLGIDCS